MAAPFISVSILLTLFFLPYISFSCPEELNCGHIDIKAPFFMNNFNRPSEDYTDNPNSACGIYLICCDDQMPTIQFNNSGKVYRVTDIFYPENILTLQDPKPERFSGSDCNFLYEFTQPNLHFDPSLAYHSFFNCQWKNYNFSRDSFNEINNATPCKDYNLYYSYGLDNQALQRIPVVCQTNQPVFEWNLTFSKDGGLSLLSASYSNQTLLERICFDHQIIRDYCSGAAERNNSKRIVIGVGAGAGFLVACSCLFLFLYWRRKRRQCSPSSLLLRTNSSEPSSKKDPELGSAHYPTQTFSYKELQEATEDFDASKELGDGGFGTVYKGKLRDGRTVAVKRLYKHNFKRLEQFMNEIAILSRLHHQNLVALYGCSSRHSRELLLVYEFVPNGTVADHLHGSRAAEGTLTWRVRMNIAIETADALAYLHAIEPQIIHRDVKTSNILLDSNFHVKVADFGLSRLFPVDATHVSTAPQGTPGYVDPEYHQCYQLTDKSDVYSFGVVLAELISSKPAVDIGRHRHEINLANMAMTKIQNCELDQLIDPGLGCDSDWEVKSMITQVAELAFRCLQGDRDMRPPIKEVLEVLQVIENGGHKTEKAAESDANTRNDIPLLKNSMPYSPDSVKDKWVSRSTTRNTSE